MCANRGDDVDDDLPHFRLLDEWLHSMLLCFLEQPFVGEFRNVAPRTASISLRMRKWSVRFYICSLPVVLCMFPLVPAVLLLLLIRLSHSIYLSSTRSFIRPSNHVFINLPTHPPIHTSVRPSMCPKSRINKSLCFPLYKF